MPSVLVEVGFLTNKKEGQYLNSKKGQQEMATTITKAILNYRDQLALLLFLLLQVLDQNAPIQKLSQLHTGSRRKKGSHLQQIHKRSVKGLVFQGSDCGKC